MFGLPADSCTQRWLARRDADADTTPDTIPKNKAALVDDDFE